MIQEWELDNRYQMYREVWLAAKALVYPENAFERAVALEELKRVVNLHKDRIERLEGS